MTTGYLYVPNEADNTVSVIDTSNDSVVATIPVSGKYADGVAVSPNGAVVYVASESGVVNVIDTATNTVTATIQVGNSGLADFVAFSPDGSKAYVTHYTGNSVTVIDTASNTVVADIAVDSCYAVAVSPDGSRAYVSGSGTVSVIDTSSNSVIDTITNNAAGSGTSTGIAVSRDGKLVYVDDWASGIVSVIDTTTNSLTGVINVGGMPYGVVFSPDGSHAYVANATGAVSVINTSSNSIIDTISVGGEAVGVAISPDGSRVYVSHDKSNTVTVIDTTTDAIVDTITVGNGPEYLAMGSSPPAPAPAQTFEVTNSNASGPGSVVQAFDDANASGAPATIDLNGNSIDLARELQSTNTTQLVSSSGNAQVNLLSTTGYPDLLSFYGTQAPNFTIGNGVTLTNTVSGGVPAVDVVDLNMDMSTLTVNGAIKAGGGADGVHVVQSANIDVGSGGSIYSDVTAIRKLGGELIMSFRLQSNEVARLSAIQIPQSMCRQEVPI
jgi:YVTN family beta-propeller protein